MNKEVEENKKKHKALKIIIWTLVIVITLGVAAFIILNILITDKNKNTFVDGGLNNQQIIEKEYVQGLSSMNKSFEFKLSQDDVNQMLTNSLKTKEVSDYVKSAYLDIDDTNFKWCFDLSVPVFTTRLIISTHIESMGNSYMFLIDSMNIGKLNAWSMLQSGGYISDDGFTSLFYHASLPIESDLEHGYFLYNPTKFISMFNLGEVTSELFALVNTPERLSVETDCIGFKLNLEGIRIASPAENEGSYDLPGQLEAIVSTNEKYNSLSIGVETSILEVSEVDFSKWIKNCYSKNKELERIESELLNTRVLASVEGVRVEFTNNELVVIFTIKLGNIYFEISENLGSGRCENSFKIDFVRSSSEGQLQMLLMDDFISKTTLNNYVTYSESNKKLSFDFTSINMTTSIRYMTTQKIKIENNKLTFILNKN